MRTRAPLARLRALPVFWSTPSQLQRPPDFFDARQLPALRGWVQRMMHFDAQLSRRLTEKRIRGLKAWEYGNLLALLAARSGSRGWSVLDVGPGDSAFPFFLAAQVGRVTAIDYARALEPVGEENARHYRARRVRFTAGSMLQLPFGTGAFDLVTCISTIEHLDDLGGGRQLPHDEFLARTRQGLREMARVLRPGGYLYLTTDVCVPEREPLDAWSSKRAPGNVRWSIYPITEIANVFLAEMRALDMEVASAGDFSPATLLEDAARSTYRGRYCTTFILFARRSGGAGAA